MSTIIPSDPNKPFITSGYKKEGHSSNTKISLEVRAKTTLDNAYTNTIKTIDTTQPAEAQESPSNRLLNAAVSKMNEFVQSIQRELHFTVDEDSGRTVVKVIDKSTNEVIRQVPPEDLMAMLKEFSKPAQPGLIFKNSA